jgi:hypothetical protein
MSSIRDLSATDLLKGIAIVVTSVIATLAWMDGHFITAAEAKEFAKKEKVDALQRMIAYQQLSLVDRDIKEEKKKPSEQIDKERLHMLYMQKEELKKQLGVK